MISNARQETWVDVFRESKKGFLYILMAERARREDSTHRRSVVLYQAHEQNEKERWQNYITQRTRNPEALTREREIRRLRAHLKRLNWQLDLIRRFKENPKREIGRLKARLKRKKAQ